MTEYAKSKDLGKPMLLDDSRNPILIMNVNSFFLEGDQLCYNSNNPLLVLFYKKETADEMRERQERENKPLLEKDALLLIRDIYPELSVSTMFTSENTCFRGKTIRIGQFILFVNKKPIFYHPDESMTNPVDMIGDLSKIIETNTPFRKQPRQDRIIETQLLSKQSSYIPCTPIIPSAQSTTPNSPSTPTPVWGVSINTETNSNLTTGNVGNFDPQPHCELCSLVPGSVHLENNNNVPLESTMLENNDIPLESPIPTTLTGAIVSLNVTLTAMLKRLESIDEKLILL